MAHFAIPPHVLVGKDALGEAVPYFKSYGERAFIVTGKHVGKSRSEARRVGKALRR